MLSICKRFHFDAAHFLPMHQGKCKNLHGHRWHVDVCISGKREEDGPQKGMIMDFGVLKEIVNPIMDEFDHRLVNDVFPKDPTAENLACHFSELIEERLPLGIYLQFVRVWETEDAYAEWRTNL